MSLLDQLSGILQQYAGGQQQQSHPAQVDQHFEQVANVAPRQEVAQGLASAFRSNQPPPFGSMLGSLFQRSDPNQRAGILNTLLQSVSAGGAMQSMGGAGGLGSLLGMFGLTGGQVTPQQAEQVPPEAVEKIAAEAEKHDPSIVDRASQFYAEHPQAVKALGGLALAMVIGHIANNQRR